MDVSLRGGTGIFCFFKARGESLRGCCRRGRGSIQALRFRAAHSSPFSIQCQLPSSALPAIATDSQEFVPGTPCQRDFRTLKSGAARECPAQLGLVTPPLPRSDPAVQGPVLSSRGLGGS